MDWIAPFLPDWQLISQVLTRIVLAVVLGGVIGWEREAQGKPAGFRTIIMICVGSTLIMLVSIYVAAEFSPAGTADPARIAAQVVTGVGFLGAGSIIQSRGSVQGLTTAATIWVVAGVGLAIGAGMTAIAILATLVILLTLFMFHRFESQVFNTGESVHAAMTFAGNESPVKAFQKLIGSLGLGSVSWRWQKPEEGRVRISLRAEMKPGKKELVLTKLQSLEGLEEFELRE